MAQTLTASAWTDELHYMSRARTFMGLAAETRLNFFGFEHFDDRLRYFNSPVTITVGGSNTNAVDPSNSVAYLKALAGTNTYTTWVDLETSLQQVWPIPSSGPFYTAFRWKVLQTDTTVTRTAVVWNTLAGSERFRVRPNGSGTMVVSLSTDGVTFDTLGSYAQDTNYHVIEIFNDGANSNCAIDGVTGTASTRRPSAATHAIFECWAGAETTGEVFIDWYAVAR